MQRYILIRIIQAIITLLILSLAIFLSVRLTGDPASLLLDPEATQEEYELLRKKLGLDRPLPVQYGIFLKDIVRLNFGKSRISRLPARDVLLQRLRMCICREL